MADDAPPPSKRSDNAAIAERLDHAEELILAGLSSGQVERQLVKEFRVSARQARRYIAQAYKRWNTTTAEDAPYRREKVFRRAERFYAKAMADKDFRAAAQGLTIQAKMAGALKQHDPERQKRLARLGPPPSDPTQALVWAQRVMLDELWDVANNMSLDPERRLRWIVEYGSKLGMTHAKTIIEDKLRMIEAHVGTDGPPDAVDE